MTAAEKGIRSARWTAAIVDVAWLAAVFSVFGSFLLPNSRWGVLTHLGIPLLVYILYSYLFSRFLGGTPAEILLGLRRSMTNGRKPQRVYDWLFQSELRRVGPARSLLVLGFLAFASIVLAAGGGTLLWLRDPTIRPYSSRTLPLFAPEPAEKKAWDVLPFFYATGAFPRPHHPMFPSLGGLEYSLPYERGPPVRFLGKILLYWRQLDSRLILTGPSTPPAPDSPTELRECASKWFGCVSARRRIWKTSIDPYFQDRNIEVSEWFEVENGFLAAEERPRGIYVRSKPNGGRVREAYYLVGPKMAIQALILDRPATEKSEKSAQQSVDPGSLASGLAERIVRSMRMSEDLLAPRAFINPKLSALRIGKKSSLQDLIAAEAVLLAKVSIEPKDDDPFYHLAGLALTLFRAAKGAGQIELAASSKTIVLSSLHYVRDVSPTSPRIAEMERFEAEVESD